MLIKVGDVFGKLTVIKDEGPGKNGTGQLLLCECECGKTRIFRAGSLRARNNQSCGDCDVFKHHKGNFGKHKTHCKQGHELSGDNLYITKKGAYVCKICRNISKEKFGKERSDQLIRDWREKNPLYRRASGLKEKYKMTLEDYQEMVDFQKGLCAICQLPPVDGKILVIDHDHSCCPSDVTCGKCIRGLVCNSCNSGMGFFKDNAEILESASAYLRKYRGSN